MTRPNIYRTKALSVVRTDGDPCVLSSEQSGLAHPNGSRDTVFCEANALSSAFCLLFLQCKLGTFLKVISNLVYCTVIAFVAAVLTS